MSSLLDEPQVASVLTELHELSDRQARSLSLLSSGRRLGALFGRPVDLNGPFVRRMLRDKLVALDPDKGRLCHFLCRSIGARRVVEVGTGFGVSTIYLAAAVRENDGERAERGRVIGTEWEVAKAAAARQNLERAGLGDNVEILQGDIRETLRDIGGEADFVLLDIWAPQARTALDLLVPQLRRGALVACDNAVRYRRDYRAYLERVRDPNGGFLSTTLACDGGLELSRWSP